MHPGFNAFAVLVLTATVLSYIAKKTGQPTVIAYIASGLLLGQVGFNLLTETEMTSIFSELGLVFLLFFIGLEIDIGKVREVLKPSAIIGILQMGMTALLGFSLAGILGFNMVESLFIGAAAMFSSTALVVKLLTDKDEATSLPGRINIGVLLVQDIAVVMILALLTVNFSNASTAILRIGEIMVLIGVTAAFSIASSRYMLPRIFRRVSENQHAFFIYGLAWAFLFISGAEHFNLSLEIGAFFAGLSLAQLPYSSELQERVRPLTDLFIAIFFVNFGLQIVPGQLSAYFFEAVIAAGVLMLGKMFILFGIIDRLKFTPETSFKASINMTQISEFSLILGALAVSENLIGAEILGFLSLVAIITMGASSYLINFNNRIYTSLEHILSRYEGEEKTDVEVSSFEDHAIIVGYNRIVERVLPVLEQQYSQIIIVDRNPRNVNKLSRLDHEYIYGDFKHGEMRKASAVKKADFILSVARDQSANHQILRDKKRETTVFLEADGFKEAGELYERGADYVIIENVVTAEKMADYLELYIDDPELFREEVEDDLETIYWGGRNDG